MHLAEPECCIWVHLGGLQLLINLHQRCEYSNLPFALIYCFYTAGSRNELEGMGTRMAPGNDTHTPKKAMTLRNILFCYRKNCKGRHTGSTNRPGSDGINNELKIMKLTRLVKQELRRISPSMPQFRYQINEFKASTFGCPGFRWRVPAKAK